MNKACTLIALLAVCAPTALVAQQPTKPNPDSQYHLGPDSLSQPGVPKGEIRGPFVLP